MEDAAVEASIVEAPATVQAVKTPERAQSDWPPAVIAGAFQTGVLGVRGLIRRGVQATFFDCDAAMPGFRSKYGPAQLCPDPDIEPQAWLRFMTDLASRFSQRPALIASSDKFVSAIAAHEDQLKHYYILSPGIRMHAQLAEKQSQYDLAATHGMPMPRTQFVGSLEEVRAFAASAMFPALIKPTHFREWQKFAPEHPLCGAKVAVARDAAELLDHYQNARGVTPQVILQEVIQGDDRAKRVYLSCYDSKSRRIASAMFRELRCDPMQFGPASVTEPVTDTEADAVCDNFLKSIGYQGICEIEVKRDVRDGRVKLIEANPRLSGGGDAAPYAGVDICWVHYLDLIGLPVVPVSPRGNDFKHIVLRADARAIPAYWRAGLLSWKELRDSYRGPLAFFDLDWADWRYSLETIYISIRALLWRIVSGMFR